VRVQVRAPTRQRELSTDRQVTLFTATGQRLSGRPRCLQGCSGPKLLKISVLHRCRAAATVNVCHGLLQQPERYFAHRESVNFPPKPAVLRGLGLRAIVHIVQDLLSEARNTLSFVQGVFHKCELGSCHSDLIPARG
jgi:hypothetical protein